MRRPLALALSTLALAGCMVGPDYHRPRVEAPPLLPHQLAGAATGDESRWWQRFADPVLDGLVAEALAHNKTVKIAAANVDQAAAVLTQVRSPLFPQASAGASGTRQRGSERGAVPIPPTVPNPQTSYQLLAGASWEIDLWGRVRRLSEAARADLLATEEARRGVILSLVGAVANTYLQLRGLDEQLLIAQRSREAYAASVKLFELKFAHGMASGLNVAAARIQAETAAAAVPQIESQVAQTENALSILLGRDPGAIPRGRSIRELALPAVPAGMPSELLERRPDIRQAEQNLIAMNARIGAAKARYFPSISLTGALGQASAELSHLFEGPARVWSFAGSLTAPLFTAGAISGQVRQAEAARTAALLGYQAAIQSAFADVDNALVAREKLAEQLSAQERLVQASAEFARLAQLQFDGGVAPYTTVLQAQQQLFPTELADAQLRALLLASSVNLYKAMGGGWLADAEAMTQASPPVGGAPPRQ
ncbi:MAG TPA: efflux transporter outer membrane subunit [Vicinamibacteria bacterium]|nr:efflux transporter outer membrane subunit [Vicinamibacteria bacterium]